jgi:hypothetical protein
VHNTSVVSNFTIRLIREGISKIIITATASSILNLVRKAPTARFEEKPSYPGKNIPVGLATETQQTWITKQIFLIPPFKAYVPDSRSDSSYRQTYGKTMLYMLIEILIPSPIFELCTTLVIHSSILFPHSLFRGCWLHHLYAHALSIISSYILPGRHRLIWNDVQLLIQLLLGPHGASTTN